MMHFTSEILSLLRDKHLKTQIEFCESIPKQACLQIGGEEIGPPTSPRLHDNLMPGKLNSKLFPISLRMNPNAMLKSGRKFHCIIQLMQNVYPRC